MNTKAINGEHVHVMSLRLPVQLYEKMLKAADGRPLNPWIRKAIEVAVGDPGIRKLLQAIVQK